MMIRGTKGAMRLHRSGFEVYNEIPRYAEGFNMPPVREGEVAARRRPRPHEEFPGLRAVAQYADGAGGSGSRRGARGPRGQPRDARKRSLGRMIRTFHSMPNNPRAFSPEVPGVLHRYAERMKLPGLAAFRLEAENVLAMHFLAHQLNGLLQSVLLQEAQRAPAGGFGEQAGKIRLAQAGTIRRDHRYRPPGPRSGGTGVSSGGGQSAHF